MNDQMDMEKLRAAYSAAYGPARKAWANDSDAHDEGLKAVVRAVVAEVKRAPLASEKPPPMTDDACPTCGPICGMREFEAPATERRRQLREMAREGQRLEQEVDHE